MRRIDWGEINSIANNQKDEWRRALYNVANELEALRREVGDERASEIRNRVTDWEVGV